MTLRVSKHSNQPCSVIFVNFYKFLNNYTSLCRHLSAQTGSRLPTGVFTPATRRNCRQLVANSCSHRRRRRDKTVSSRRRRRCVLNITGVNCALRNDLTYLLTFCYAFCRTHAAQSAVECSVICCRPIDGVCHCKRAEYCAKWFESLCRGLQSVTA